MSARVTLQVGSQAPVTLFHGDLIGRLWSAALCVRDPRVSEAHAMISVRDQQLVVLALRRRIRVDGQPAAELALTAGRTFELADGLPVRVVEVHLPDEVVGVRAPEVPLQVVHGSCSLYAGGRPRVASGYDPLADGWIWSDGARWTGLSRGGAPRVLAPGDSLIAGGVPFEIEVTRLTSAAATRAEDADERPLRIVAWYDTVDLGPVGGEAHTIGGIGARLISELVAVGGPAPWEAIARALWRDAAPDADLRHAWDVQTSRLRARLRALGLRGDLVSVVGGQVALRLRPGDQVEDRT